MSSLVRELELEREQELRRARTNFLSYCQYVNQTYRANWHHVATANLVQHALDRKTPRQFLLSSGHTNDEINQFLARPHELTGLYGGMTRPDMADKAITGIQVHFAPRHGKSELISRQLPAFFLGKNPDKHVIGASHTAALAQEMGEDVQRIMDSDAHLRVFPCAKIANPMQEPGVRTKQRFTISRQKGSYRGVGVGGNIVGRAGHLIVPDDLVKGRKAAESPVEQMNIINFYRGDLYTRREKNAIMALINTRYHLNDISGMTIRAAQENEETQQWMCLVLPAILDGEPGPCDFRRQGEALWPWKFDVLALQGIRATQTEYEFQAQFMQQPVHKEGALIKLAWIQRCDVLPSDLSDYTLSVDLSFGNKGDYAAFGVFARKGANHYCVEMIEQRLDFNEQIAMFRALSGKYPLMHVKIVENAANGAALIASLKQQIPGIIAYSPKTSKELRVQAISPMFEAGNFWVPKAPWADKLITQLCTFPSGAHDDMVDSVSQYCLRVQQKAYNFSNFRAVGIKRDEPLPWR